MTQLRTGHYLLRLDVVRFSETNFEGGMGIDALQRGFIRGLRALGAAKEHGVTPV